MWLSNLQKTLRSPRAPRTALRRSLRPCIEALECRALLSTVTVLNNLDHGPGSLRAALATAHDGDQIRFADSLNATTITLTSGPLLVDNNLSILGPGSDTLAVSGGNNMRVLQIAAPVNVTFADLMTVQGQATEGAGILNSGTLRLMNTVLKDNRADGGPTSFNGAGKGGAGAQLFGATIFAVRHVFKDNEARGDDAGGAGVGGAIYNLSGKLILEDCTFADNQAFGADGGIGGNGTFLGEGGGGAIDNFSGSAVIESCRFLGNLAQA